MNEEICGNWNKYYLSLYRWDDVSRSNNSRVGNVSSSGFMSPTIAVACRRFRSLASFLAAWIASTPEDRWNQACLVNWGSTISHTFCTSHKFGISTHIYKSYLYFAHTNAVRMMLTEAFKPEKNTYVSSTCHVLFPLFLLGHV